jgi:hypothetical protein
VPIQVVCPTCGSKLKAPDNAAGRKITCLGCGSPLFVPARAIVPPPPPPVAGAPFGAVRGADRMPPPSPRDTPVLDNLEDRRCLSRDPERPAQESKAAHSLGIASMVLGVVALPFALLPCIGVLSLPLSGLGVLLGLVGGVVSLTRQGRGIGFPIAGTAISGMAVLIGIFWLALMARTADMSAEQDRIARGGEQQSANSDPSWAPTDKPVRHGDLQVEIVKTVIGKVPLRDFGEDALSKDDLLMIKLNLLNMNATKKVEYRSWAGGDLSLSRDYATLKDNFGNSYKRIGFSLRADPVGAIERSKSLHPDKPVTDVLVFEVPLETATHLDLELPAKNYGGEGLIRFRIPMMSVEGSRAYIPRMGSGHIWRIIRSGVSQFPS